MKLVTINKAAGKIEIADLAQSDPEYMAQLLARIADYIGPYDWEYMVENALVQGLKGVLPMLALTTGDLSKLADLDLLAAWNWLCRRYERGMDANVDTTDIVDAAQRVMAEISSRALETELIPQKPALVDMVTKRQQQDAEQGDPRKWKAVGKAASSEDEQQVIYYIAVDVDVADTDDEHITKSEATRLAHDYVKRTGGKSIWLNHEGPFEAQMVETWIAKSAGKLGSEDYKDGDWLIGVHIPDKDKFGIMKALGTGVSIGGYREIE